MSDQQLQKKNQQQIIRTPEFVNYKQVDDHIGKMKTAAYEIKDQQYTMYFESQEEMDEADRILDSDEALIQYYEKNAPEKLAGLRSKNFFNFPGKKAEKKKLRKAFFSQEQKLIDDYRKTHDVADKTDEQVKKSMQDEEAGTISDYIKTYEGYSEEDSYSLLEKTYTMNPVKRNRYYNHIKKLKDKAIQSRVNNPLFKEFRLFRDSGFITDMEFFNSVEYNFLYTCKETEKISFMKKNLEAMGYYKIIDADLYGEDTEELKEYQTKVAKLYNSSADYKSYRLTRRAQKFHDKRGMPEIVDKEIEKGKLTKGDFERAVAEFMLPVEYKTENGKQVPKTMQDKKNLEFNTMWAESYISEKEEDWNFRFEEMAKYIDTTYEKRLPQMQKLVGALDMEKQTVQMDENEYLDKIEEYREENSRTLILSGISSQQTRTNFFKSKYFLSLSKERQEELNKKDDVLSAYGLVVKFIFLKNKVDLEQGKIANNGENEKAVPVIPILVGDLKEKLEK